MRGASPIKAHIKTRPVAQTQHFRGMEYVRLNVLAKFLADLRRTN
jgi:hypothetical protein